MKSLIERFCLITFSILMYEVASGAPVPSLDVPSVVEQSDVVVVGTVRSAQDAGPTSVGYGGKSLAAHLIRSEMEVDGVLKGDVDGRKLSFQFVMTDQPVGYATVTAPSYRIVFLRKGNAGWSFASPYHASLPAVPGTQAGEVRDPLASVAIQLGAVVESTESSSDEKQMALFALSTIHMPQATKMIQEGLKLQDPVLRLGAAGFLLQRNNLSGLSLAESALVNAAGEIPKYVLHNLAFSISEGVRDENAVPSLTRLLGAQETETRRAAVAALSHSGSSAALEPLALALNDADLQVRYNAVVGLANMTGQPDWRANMDLFQSEEDKYLGHWRDWALKSSSSTKTP